MEAAKLVMLCIAAICGCAACIGEVSAIACPEAFTLGKPQSFGALSPYLLGPLWGVMDFLHPAALVGIAITMASHFGNRPSVKAFFFRKPLVGHVSLMALTACVGGVIGYLAVKNGAYAIIGPLQDALPPEQHAALGAVWWASFGAQAANGVGGITIATWIWKKRAVFERMVQEGQAAK